MSVDSMEESPQGDPEPFERLTVPSPANSGVEGSIEGLVLRRVYPERLRAQRGGDEGCFCSTDLPDDQPSPASS